MALDGAMGAGSVRGGWGVLLEDVLLAADALAVVRHRGAGSPVMRR